ncbi:DNA mismatch repair endonuclease MutL [Lapidilactobacillus luobeiensis]|uniref:DNA mismatch repair endonuclease MutL n=1 Tax=Lapidilactobacillus luobeiensis TaxID=2950371 RepID=UPI0021C4969B|nr:DNA mismatch repair endonuclease MutL [Lapidilactobacillus luobeiensis]
MAKIHQLSALLSNQIAAGEVIERPASVVKELVENAIDAGATKVQVFLKESGLKEIQVIDNGSGFDPEDLQIAFLRHTTSKINSREDLFKIHSLGFRGEALASIASVAKVTLTTSNGAVAAGRRMTITGEDGQIEKASHPQGTTMTVADLFYNTPARLKYLKSLATELRHSADIMNRIVLSYPQIAFSLISDGRELLTTTGSGDLQQVIAGIYGLAVAKELLPVHNKNLDFELNGYISRPAVTRSSKNYLSFLINGRYIRNYQLNKALIKGYGSKLMVGRYPVVVIAITMDPLLVDVNVHPTKREVRLSKEPELMDLLTQTIRQVLGAVDLIPDALTNLKSHQKKIDLEQLQIDLQKASQTYPASSSVPASTVTPKNPSVDAGALTTPVEPSQPQKSRDLVESSSAVMPTNLENHQVSQAQKADPNNATPSELGPIDTSEPVTNIFQDTKALAQWDAWLKADDQPRAFTREPQPMTRPAQPVIATSTETVVGNTDLVSETSADPVVGSIQRSTERPFPELRYLGQIHGTYLVAESTDGFYLIDQHAAQERIKYEQFRVSFGQVSQDQQNLLVPLVLTYPASDYVQIKAHLALLADVGLELEDFGENTFILHSHPVWFQSGQEEKLIREMIDYFLSDGQISVAHFREKAAIMLSCKLSIKANHHLEPVQAKKLLHDLAQTENPFNCPHGRPVLVHFDDQDLQKMFKRIQDPHRSWSGD